jgi:hypothetical protein
MPVAIRILTSIIVSLLFLTPPAFFASTSTLPAGDSTRQNNADGNLAGKDIQRKEKS